MHNIRKTLDRAHRALSQALIDHALIGGLALGVHGIHRATMDVDFLIEGSVREQAKQALENNGFKLDAETDESLHFSGYGNLDLLLANRTPSREMLKRAGSNTVAEVKCLDPEDIIGLKIQAYTNDRKRAFQDKADIAALVEKCANLDWDRVKSYAELFEEWDAIEMIKKSHDI